MRLLNLKKSTFLLDCGRWQSGLFLLLVSCVTLLLSLSSSDYLLTLLLHCSLSTRAAVKLVQQSAKRRRVECGQVCSHCLPLADPAFATNPRQEGRQVSPLQRSNGGLERGGVCCRIASLRRRWHGRSMPWRTHGRALACHRRRRRSSSSSSSSSNGSRSRSSLFAWLRTKRICVAAWLVHKRNDAVTQQSIDRGGRPSLLLLLWPGSTAFRCVRSASFGCSVSSNSLCG